MRFEQKLTAERGKVLPAAVTLSDAISCAKMRRDVLEKLLEARISAQKIRINEGASEEAQRKLSVLECIRDALAASRAEEFGGAARVLDALVEFGLAFRPETTRLNPRNLLRAFYESALPRVLDAFGRDTEKLVECLHEFSKASDSHTVEAVDLYLLQKIDSTGMLLGRIVDIKDMHASHRTVLKVTFEDKGERRVVYAKNKDCSPDAISVRLLALAGLNTYRIEQHGGWGILEEVRGEGILKVPVEGYMVRELGRFLAAAHCFGFYDFHEGNMIVDRQNRRLTVIDLEGVFKLNESMEYFWARDIVIALNLDREANAGEKRPKLALKEYIPRNELKRLITEGFLDGIETIRANRAEILEIAGEAQKTGIKVGVEDSDQFRYEIDKCIVSVVDAMIKEDPAKPLERFFKQYDKVLDGWLRGDRFV